MLLILARPQSSTAEERLNDVKKLLVDEIDPTKDSSTLGKALKQPQQQPREDWGGKVNDQYSANVRVSGLRIPTAFLLKGNGLRRTEMRIADCGNNGDQLLRLFHSPAYLFVVQFVDNISEAVVSDMQSKVAERRSSGTLAWYLIMDGQDTARLLHAYEKLGCPS